jgi:hypothetical protein
MLVWITTTDSLKEFKRFLNSLRCPLCNSQLDGNITLREASLYCVGNNDEYRGKWTPNSIFAQTETIKYYYSDFEYDITINQIGNQIGNQFVTRVIRYNADVSIKYKNSTRKELFEYTGAKLGFFRKRMDQDVFLKKLKTYQVFK